MYIAPMILAPYMMFSKWAGFWGATVQKPNAASQFPAPIPEAINRTRSRIAVAASSRTRPRVSKKKKPGVRSKKRKARGRR